VSQKSMILVFWMTLEEKWCCTSSLGTSNTNNSSKERFDMIVRAVQNIHSILCVQGGGGKVTETPIVLRTYFIGYAKKVENNPMVAICNISIFFHIETFSSSRPTQHWTLPKSCLRKMSVIRNRNSSGIW
jgi:hypothetical protein